MLASLRLEHKQNKSSNLFRTCIFLFLSYSFGIETINTFIHSCSSLENHTRFKTKIGEVYTPFQTKTAQKPYPMGQWGGTYLHSLYKGVSSPPPPGRLLLLFLTLMKNRLLASQVSLEKRDSVLWRILIRLPFKSWRIHMIWHERWNTLDAGHMCFIPRK